MIFPGGFGTMDEFFEILRLRRRRSFERFVVVYGSRYWNRLINFQTMVDANDFCEDLELFQSWIRRREGFEVSARWTDQVPLLGPEPKHKGEPGEQVPEIAKTNVKAASLHHRSCPVPR